MPFVSVRNPNTARRDELGRGGGGWLNSAGEQGSFSRSHSCSVGTSTTTRDECGDPGSKFVEMGGMEVHTGIILFVAFDASSGPV